VPGYLVGGKITSGIEVEVGPMPEYEPAQKIRTSGDPELIKDAARLLLAAKRPIVIAGNGIILSAANDEFKEFIELLGIPFLTTPGGRGIFSENHSLA